MIPRRLPGLPFPVDPEAFEQRLLGYLRGLVSIGGYTKDRESLREKCAYISGKLAALGLGVEELDGELSPHISAETSACGNEGYALLVGHYDIALDASSEERRVTEEGNFLYGPGIGDMSGGIAVILGVLELLGQEKLLGEIPVKTVLVSDEERGSKSSLEVLEAEKGRPGFALVFEGGRENGSVVLGRKGRFAVRFAFHGRAAHAGNEPWKGINALTESVPILLELEREARERGLSLVAGGVTKVFPGLANTVPERAVFSGDLRYEDHGKARRFIQYIENRVSSRALGPRGEVEFVSERPPWNPSENDIALYEGLKEMGREIGLELPFKKVGGGSDANTMASLGIPVVDGLGPCGGDFHTVKEFVVRETMLERTVLVACFLARRFSNPRRK